MKKLFALLLVLSPIVYVQAQGINTVFLEGTIGNSPIVLKLDYSETGCIGGNYFYKKYKRDIPFEIEGGEEPTLKFAVKDWDENLADYVPSESFEVTKNSDGTWFGIWSSKKKKLDMKLRPVDISKVKHVFGNADFVERLRTNDPYSYLQTADLKFENSTPELSLSDKKIIWCKEVLTNINIFRIESGYKETVKQYINDRLAEQQLNEIISFLQCRVKTGSGDYNITAKPQLMNEDLFSYSILSEYYCGGAHPDFSMIGYNYDLKTKQNLTMENVLYFGKGDIPEENSDAWFKYKSDVYGPKILEFMKELYPNKMKKTDDDCEYDDPEVWRFSSFYFTPEGLYIGAFFPRVMRLCDNPDWSVIPYKKLKPFMLKTYSSL